MIYCKKLHSVNKKLVELTYDQLRIRVCGVIKSNKIDLICFVVTLYPNHIKSSRPIMILFGFINDRL